MSCIAILVAETKAGLDALADSSDLTILANTTQKFDELCTYKTPAMDDVREIATQSSGWICLAKVND